MGISRRHYVVVNTPEAEFELLASLARKSKVGVLEIGVFRGRTSVILAKNADPGIPVFGVDPIIPDSMGGEIGSLDAIREATCGFPNYTFIHDYSYNVVRSWETPLDFIFIDGSHHYEDVKRDYEEWLPKIVPGGTIAIHDSTSDRGGPDYWPGPTRLTRELIESDTLEYITSVHTATVFRKPI